MNFGNDEEGGTRENLGKHTLRKMKGHRSDGATGQARLNLTP